MSNPGNLANLRSLAAAARQHGCLELALQVELLLETAAMVCGGLPCVRCGGQCGDEELVGAMVKVHFGAGSRRSLESLQGALCDDCCDLLSAWAPGLSGSDK